MTRAVLAVVALVLALAAPAGAQGPLVIWSSLPLTGPGAGDARDVRDAERLALEEAGGAAGGAQIVLRSRNDATRGLGGWDPGTVAAIARRAAQDAATLAYLGEFNSGATAIATPILNEAGIPQITPTSTYAGLTRSPGGTAGEPEKYYPTGQRTLFRVAPADHLQAQAIAALLAQRGVRRLALAHDRELYGRILGRMVADAARSRGIAVVTNRLVARRARNAAAIARRVRAARADGFVFTGVTATGGPQVVRAVAARVPRIPLVAPDGCLDRGFTRRLGSAAARRTLITADFVPAGRRGPAGAAFAQRFRARWRRTPGPWAAYGYEAMALALDAVSRAGQIAGLKERRAAVLDALRRTRDRDSVLGRYSIDEQGDTTLTAYGIYAVRSGFPRFATVIDSAAR